MKQKEVKMVLDIQENNPLKALSNYNQRMTVSKVVKFFERQNIFFTKTMLQNYVRIGILPELIEKRYYMKNHLIILVLIENFKYTFSLDEIKNFFEPFLNKEKSDLIDIEDFYNTYLLNKAKEEDNMKIYLKNIPHDFNNFKENTTDEKILLTNLSIMTKATVCKQMYCKNMK